MHRLPRYIVAALLGVALLLSGCQATPEPTIQPTATPPGEPIVVFVHCGLDWPVIAYAGSHWKFDAGHDPNPPPGWTGGGDTIHVRTLDDGTVQALGPDGLVYRLVETDATQPDSPCM